MSYVTYQKPWSHTESKWVSWLPCCSTLAPQAANTVWCLLILGPLAITTATLTVITQVFLAISRLPWGLRKWMLTEWTGCPITLSQATAADLTLFQWMWNLVRWRGLSPGFWWALWCWSEGWRGGATRIHSESCVKVRKDYPCRYCTLTLQLQRITWGSFALLLRLWHNASPQAHWDLSNPP